MEGENSEIEYNFDLRTLKPNFESGMTNVGRFLLQKDEELIELFDHSKEYALKMMNVESLKNEQKSLNSLFKEDESPKKCIEENQRSFVLKELKNESDIRNKQSCFNNILKKRSFAKMNNRFKNDHNPSRINAKFDKKGKQDY
jgi:hypothetical protein